ncbi:hypothetical protein ABK040_000135 [Willaertia magna]
MSSSENPFINLPDEVIHLIASFLIDNFSLDSTCRKRINSLEPLSLNSSKKTYYYYYYRRSTEKLPFSQPTPISSSFIYFHLIGRLSKSLYIRMHQPMFWREHVFPILLKNNALLQIEEEHLNDNKNNKACNKEENNIIGNNNKEIENEEEQKEDEGILQNVSFLMNYCNFPKLLIKGFYHVKFLRHLFKQFENTLNNYSMNHLKVLNINIETFIVSEIIPNIINNCNVLENLTIYSKKFKWDHYKFNNVVLKQLNSLKHFEYHILESKNNLFDNFFIRTINDFYNLLIPFIPNLNYIHVPIISPALMISLSIYCKQLESMVCGGIVYLSDKLTLDKNLIETIYNNNLTNLKVFVLKNISQCNWYDAQSFHIIELIASLCELYQNTLQTLIITSQVECINEPFQTNLPKTLKYLNLAFPDISNIEFVNSMFENNYYNLETIILEKKSFCFKIKELNKLTKLKNLKLRVTNINDFIKDLVKLKPNIPLEKIELLTDNQVFDSENLIELLNNYHTVKHLSVYSCDKEQIKERDIPKLLSYNNLSSFHNFDIESVLIRSYFIPYYYWKDISLNSQLFKHLNEISIMIYRFNLPQLITNIDNVTVLNLFIMESDKDKSIKIIDNLELLVLVTNFCKKLQFLTINSEFYTSNDKQLIDSEFKLFGNPLSLQHFSFTHLSSSLSEGNEDNRLTAYLKTLSMCYILFRTSLENSISEASYFVTSIDEICDNYDLNTITETEIFENLVMHNFSIIINNYFTNELDIDTIRNEFKNTFVDRTIELKENSSKLKRTTLLSPVFKEIRGHINEARMQETFNLF